MIRFQCAVRATGEVWFLMFVGYEISHSYSARVELTR
jgi:hypothetical protein